MSRDYDTQLARACARMRALSKLKNMYEDDYKKLYEEELAELGLKPGVGDRRCGKLTPEIRKLIRHLYYEKSYSDRAIQALLKKEKGIKVTHQAIGQYLNGDTYGGEGKING